MRRIFSNSIKIACSLLIATSAAFALEAEYKNSLVKVELSKANENSYNVNLYTKKKFAEPVKIIKKSDLNYYILLPETNNAGSISASGAEIRNVSAKTHPYAGADINNGYTKIDINTTKPLNFNVTTRNLTNQNVVPKPVTTSANKVSTPVKPAETAQKPIQQAAQTTTQKPVVQQKPQVQPKPQVSTTPKTQTQAQKPQVQPKTEPETKKKEQLKKSSETIKTEKRAEKKTEKQETKTKKQTQKTTEKTVVKENETSAKENYTLENSNPEEENILDKNSETNEEIAQEETALEEEILNQDTTEVVDNSFQGKFYQILKKIKHKLAPYKNKIENKTQEYGLDFNNFMLMILAAFLTFFIMLIILSKKPKKQVKLKSKKDLIDKQKTKPQAQPKTAPKKQEEAKYFVFDKNTQSAIKKPVSSVQKQNTPRKNYELSSYDPKKAAAQPVSKNKTSKQNQGEEEIIHKILKENDYNNLEPVEYLTPKEEVKPPKEPIVDPVVPEPVALVEPEAVVLEETDPNEPIVLSSVEIAPKRGFMCVSYEGNIRLLGYIFEEVFALYNFKKSELEDYSIKFRMSEETEKGANFIVKIDKTKLLISVSKTSMGLEVAM